MELRDYWATVKRRWKLIVVSVLLAVGLAGVLTVQATPQYASSAQLFISTTPSNTDAAYQGSLFATQRVTSYVDLVKTRKLADQVADDLGGDLDPAVLLSDVQAEAVPETVNMMITATNPDPSLARDIAQGYATALISLVAEIETPVGRTKAPIRASIVDNADINRTAVSPNPMRNLGLALVLGLLVGVGLAVVRDLLDTSLKTSGDVADVSAAPLLGQIALEKAAAQGSPGEILSKFSPWAEAFRVLRTNMQYVDVDAQRRVFVVSSSLPGEGKSTVTAHLATTLAISGNRVAFVDCDLRRPTAARLLGLDNAVGTTSVLIGKVSLADAMQPYGDAGLQVLTSGPIPPNPAELLQSHAMQQLIKELSAEFDVVIIDAPPLLPVTDAALLAAQADGLIVVVRHGKTSKDQLRHALERVEAVGGKCAGVVMNMTPARHAGKSGYGYGYGYGYAPAPTQDDAARMEGEGRGHAATRIRRARQRKTRGSGE